MRAVDRQLPPPLQHAIVNINPAFWLKRAFRRTRHCSNIHFGLGIPRNILRAKGSKYIYGKYTHLLPELQQQLLSYIRSVAPEIHFSSVILNKYERGDRIAAHVDGNIFPQQFCGRFGVAEGAELCVGRVRVGNGVFVMNTNIPHEVSRCEAGVRFSIVTFMKRDSVKLVRWPVFMQLGLWGFPVHLPLLTLLVLLILRCPGSILGGPDKAHLWCGDPLANYIF